MTSEYRNHNPCPFHPQQLALFYVDIRLLHLHSARVERVPCHRFLLPEEDRVRDREGKANAKNKKRRQDLPQAVMEKEHDLRPQLRTSKEDTSADFMRWNLPRSSDVPILNNISQSA